MQQPAPDKICSYQAVAIALQQIGEDESYCKYLLCELDKWLAWILKRKVMFIRYAFFNAFNVRTRFVSGRGI
jgi:hypothetical protein